MKIVFTGAQGTGKTTLLDKLEEGSYLPFNIEFIRNFTRDVAKSGRKINGEGNDRTQIDIMSKHFFYAHSKNEYVIDRCALDGLVYTIYLYRKGKVSNNVLEYAEAVFKHCIDRYSVIFYLTPEFQITSDEYRSEDKNYQKEIAEIFEECINRYNVNVIKLTGTVDQRLDTILKTLRDLGYIREENI